MADKYYSSRDVLDKLGIKAGHALAFDEAGGVVDPGLRRRAEERSGTRASSTGVPLDVVLATVDVSTDAVAVLSRWRPLIKPNGAVWLLTPKRGIPGYVDQRNLIEAGGLAGMVDNKSCSVSEEVSGMRFVIRLRDRS